MGPTHDQRGEEYHFALIEFTELGRVDMLKLQPAGRKFGCGDDQS